MFICLIHGYTWAVRVHNGLKCAKSRGLFFFRVSVLSFVSLCVPRHRSASPKKEHVSAFLGISYENHVTQMARTGHANFQRNSLVSTILTLNQVLEEESECQGKGLSTQQPKTVVVVMNL